MRSSSYGTSGVDHSRPHRTGRHCRRRLAEREIRAVTCSRSAPERRPGRHRIRVRQPSWRGQLPSSYRATAAAGRLAVARSDTAHVAGTRSNWVQLMRTAMPRRAPLGGAGFRRRAASRSVTAGGSGGFRACSAAALAGDLVAAAPATMPPNQSARASPGASASTSSNTALPGPRSALVVQQRLCGRDRPASRPAERV